MCLFVCLCVCLPVCLSVCPQISHEVNGFDLTSSALYHPSASVSSIFIDYVHSNFFGYIFFYLTMSWAWWDWPLTCLTNRPSVLVLYDTIGWVILTRKIVSEMTWNVSSADVKPYYTTPYRGCRPNLMDVSRGQGVTFYKWLSVGVDPIPDVDWDHFHPSLTLRDRTATFYAIVASCT